MVKNIRLKVGIGLSVTILIVALLGSNIGWVYYESQFEKFEIQQEASSEGGGNAVVNNGGDFNYGTCETND